jgi:hypothetical protein
MTIPLWLLSPLPFVNVRVIAFLVQILKIHEHSNGVNHLLIKKYSRVHAKIKNNHKNVTRWLLNDNLVVMKFLQCQNVHHDMILIQQMH